MFKIRGNFHGFGKQLFNLKLYSSNIQESRQQLMRKGLPKRKPIDGVKNIIVVASSKGGVGKSTISTNLAISLSQLEPKKSTGLLDLDIFGPSIPYLMNLTESGKPDLCNKTNKMLPFEKYGIKCMSMGFLIDNQKPIIWRGLLVMQAIDNLLRNVNWDQLDYLIIDTPPGTGDTQLSLVQNVPISGTVLVTTPQTLSQKILFKSIEMFRTLQVPIIGTVSNMDHFQCPNCSHTIPINNSYQIENDINILQKIPLDFTNITLPITIEKPEHQISYIYKQIAKQIHDFVTKK